MTDIAMTTAEVRERIDARPVRPSSTDTPWSHAIALRDSFEAAVRDVLQREAIEAAVFISGNGSYPPWVKLEAWLPDRRGDDRNGRERVDLLFTIGVKPYHEHETIVSATMTRGRKKIAVADRPDFSVRSVEEWTLYAIDRAGKPSNYTPVQDAFIAFFLPIFSPYRNKIRADYKTFLSMPVALTLLALLLILAGAHDMSEYAGYGHPVGAYLIIGSQLLLAIAALIVRLRKKTISVTPQPALPPRNLVMVDSWHAVVAELGRDFDSVKRRLVETLTTENGLGIVVQPETYTHRAPNGYEQREQVVVSKDQGAVHVHVYQFGHDIFVGWNAYLNWAHWGETRPVSVKVRKGNSIEFRQLQPTVYIPNQFDLIDLSSLSELVHRRLERELKALLKEKAIDQEIDFKVIRGDRDRALDEERHGKKKSKGWGYRASGA